MCILHICTYERKIFVNSSFLNTRAHFTSTAKDTLESFTRPVNCLRLRLCERCGRVEAPAGLIDSPMKQAGGQQNRRARRPIAGGRSERRAHGDATRPDGTREPRQKPHARSLPRTDARRAQQQQGARGHSTPASRRHPTTTHGAGPGQQTRLDNSSPGPAPRCGCSGKRAAGHA